MQIEQKPVSLSTPRTVGPGNGVRSPFPAPPATTPEPGSGEPVDAVSLSSPSPSGDATSSDGPALSWGRRLAVGLCLGLAGLSGVGAAVAAPPSISQASALPSASASQGQQQGVAHLGVRVLMVGDSHTVGTFGQELDRLLRTSGATVDSFGSAGSSPSWWIDGTPTHAGYVARHADGTVEEPFWKIPHATPKLEGLIDRLHPDVLIVNHGANFRGGSPSEIRRQVDLIGNMASRHHVRLVWVGPPEQRGDDTSPARLDAFYSTLRSEVGRYGELVDSRSFTPHYAGPDGVHYRGREGSRIATGWARGVYQTLQALTEAPDVSGGASAGNVAD